MQTPQLIGRKPERALLQEALHSAEAEMVAVIGRRRVGKTFLITEASAFYKKGVAADPGAQIDLVLETTC